MSVASYNIRILSTNKLLTCFRARLAWPIDRYFDGFSVCGYLWWTCRYCYSHRETFAYKNENGNFNGCSSEVKFVKKDFRSII